MVTWNYCHHTRRLMSRRDRWIYRLRRLAANPECNFLILAAMIGLNMYIMVTVSAWFFPLLCIMPMAHMAMLKTILLRYPPHTSRLYRSRDTAVIQMHHMRTIADSITMITGKHSGSHPLWLQSNTHDCMTITIDHTPVRLILNGCKDHALRRALSDSTSKHTLEKAAVWNHEEDHIGHPDADVDAMLIKVHDVIQRIGDAAFQAEYQGKTLADRPLDRRLLPVRSDRRDDRMTMAAVHELAHRVTGMMQASSLFPDHERDVAIRVIDQQVQDVSDRLMILEHVSGFDATMMDDWRASCQDVQRRLEQVDASMTMMTRDEMSIQRSEQVLDDLERSIAVMSMSTGEVVS